MPLNYTAPKTKTVPVRNITSNFHGIVNNPFCLKLTPYKLTFQDSVTGVRFEKLFMKYTRDRIIDLESRKVFKYHANSRKFVEEKQDGQCFIVTAWEEVSLNIELAFA